MIGPFKHLQPVLIFAKKALAYLSWTSQLYKLIYLPLFLLMCYWTSVSNALAYYSSAEQVFMRLRYDGDSCCYFYAGTWQRTINSDKINKQNYIWKNPLFIAIKKWFLPAAPQHSAKRHSAGWQATNWNDTGCLLFCCHVLVFLG